MNIGFENTPAVIALLAIALLSLISIIALRGRYPALKASHLLLNLITLLLLGAALCGPYFESSRDSRRGSVLLDISQSMEEGVAQSLMNRAKELLNGADSVDIYPFSLDGGGVSTSLKSSTTFAKMQASWAGLNIGGTNLENGLRSIQGVGDVVLISDGRPTAGEFDAALGEIAASGQRIFPLTPIDQPKALERFSIAKLHAPLTAPSKKKVEISTSIVNSSGTQQPGTLEIKHDEKVVFKERVSVAAGSEAVFTAQSDPDLDGLREITATLTPDDKAFSPSVERIYLSTEQRERVLLIGGGQEDNRFLEQALREQAYQLTGVVAGSPELSKATLSEYSVVVLNNIGREELPRKILDGIPAFTRAGGGLVMIGGNKSFGLGGYIGSALEAILPVELVPPQTAKKRLNVAVALVMDKSGSMSQGQKLDFAKEAASETVRNLKDEDYISVVGFDDGPFIVIKLTRVGEIRAYADERIGRLFAAGRTNLLPAIDEARRGLVRAEAGRKHIIVLTDGRLPDEGPFYLELVRDMRLMGITVSTVLLGGDMDFAFLKSLAEAGGGGFYQTADARNLPRIFLQDVKVSTGEKTLKESAEYAVRLASNELFSTELRSFPPVNGYVQTRPRDGADLELVALAGDAAEPLLASWQVGQGRSIAFTSDANGRWSKGWIPWSRFHEFWSGVIDSARTKENGEVSSARFDLRWTVEQGDLKLDLALFSTTEQGEILGELVSPTGEIRPINFESLARGHFQSTLSAPLAGRNEVRISVAGKKLTPVAFHLSGELFGERRGLGFNLPLLEKIASRTGGVVNPESAALMSGSKPQIERTSLSKWLSLLALVTLILGVMFREIPALRRVSIA